MDQDILVKERIEDGRKIIAGLAGVQFDVTAALWVRTSAEGLWYLYVASTSLSTLGLGQSYQVVYGVLQEIPHAETTFSQIELRKSDDPIAQSAIEIRDRDPLRVAIRCTGKRLGNLTIEEAYIYPRAGSMTSEEVLHATAHLMNQKGPQPIPIVTLRDDSRFQGVPLRITKNEPSGELQIVFHEVATSQWRTVPVDDIVDIIVATSVGGSPLTYRPVPVDDIVDIL